MTRTKPSFGSVIDVRDDTVAAASELGYEVVYSGDYDSLGESNWRPFAEAIRDADVQVFDFVGEPTYLGQLLLALDEIDYHPRYIVLNANFYDTLFLETSGSIAENTFVRLQFTLQLRQHFPLARGEFDDLRIRHLGQIVRPAARLHPAPPHVADAEGEQALGGHQAEQRATRLAGEKRAMLLHRVALRHLQRRPQPELGAGDDGVG